MSEPHDTDPLALLEQLRAAIVTSFDNVTEAQVQRERECDALVAKLAEAEKALTLITRVSRFYRYDTEEEMKRVATEALAALRGQPKGGDADAGSGNSRSAPVEANRPGVADLACNKCGQTFHHSEIHRCPRADDVAPGQPACPDKSCAIPFDHEGPHSVDWPLDPWPRWLKPKPPATLPRNTGGRWGEFWESVKRAAAHAPTWIGYETSETATDSEDMSSPATCEHLLGVNFGPDGIFCADCNEQLEASEVRARCADREREHITIPKRPRLPVCRGDGCIGYEYDLCEVHQFVIPKSDAVRVARTLQEAWDGGYTTKLRVKLEELMQLPWLCDALEGEDGE